jgi:hypothetical protein
MSAYLQQGHASWPLIEEPDVGEFAGVVVSPVNDAPEVVKDRLDRLGDQRKRLEVILDPQLYNPATGKGSLAQWSYYATEFDTADASDVSWWADRGIKVADAAAAIGADALCTPVQFPKSYPDDYYKLTIEATDAVHRYAKSIGLDTLLTAVVAMRDLVDPNRARQIASILSSTVCDRIYLTFLPDEQQLREPLRDMTALPTAIHLVRLLSSQMRVHVAYCGHDLVLWKWAGAHDASAGKFFNLRRFSPARWEDEKSRGSKQFYWNESKLLTYLRDQEVLRLERQGWFEHVTFPANPASSRILEILRSGSGEPWEKLSWIQFLRWFCNAERMYGTPRAAETKLEDAVAKWYHVNDELKILFTDSFNDGRHARVWLGAVREASQRR